MTLAAPFPYFGGKRRAAPRIWQALGDPSGYSERPMTYCWTNDRLPTATDADLHGQVRWGAQHPGLLCHWSEVRPGEIWSRSAAWKGAEPEPPR